MFSLQKFNLLETLREAITSMRDDTHTEHGRAAREAMDCRPPRGIAGELGPRAC